MKPATLLRWYPRAWRERYSAELAALIQDNLDEGRPAWQNRWGTIGFGRPGPRLGLSSACSAERLVGLLGRRSGNRAGDGGRDRHVGRRGHRHGETPHAYPAG